MPPKLLVQIILQPQWAKACCCNCIHAP